MQYLGLAVVVALLALIVLLVALRMLLGGNWLLGWLRGTCGFLLLALASVVGSVAFEVSGYQPVPSDKPLATVSFQGQGNQRYEVAIKQGRHQRSVVLEGDLWQLDVHVLHWNGLAALIGLESGYRLERISGRYLSVEQQEQARHLQASLAENKSLPVDLGHWLRVAEHDIPFFESQAQRVSFMPIADGAVYEIELSPTGLLAKPVNAEASRALKDW